jgi:uncharacterized membrane protein YedE/YeeE
MNFTLLCILGLIFGLGFGFFVQRAGLCFAHGLAEIYIGKGKRIAGMFLVIFIITAAGFLLSGYINPSLGLQPVGQIRGSGLINILSGIIFGAGILLNGGCILGTLRQIGEGNMTFLIVLLSFIPGMALIINVVDPALEKSYNIQNLLLKDIFNTNAWIITTILIILAIILLVKISAKKRKEAK